MKRARTSNHASRITLSAGSGIPLIPSLIATWLEKAVQSLRGYSYLTGRFIRKEGDMLGLSGQRRDWYGNYAAGASGQADGERTNDPVRCGARADSTVGPSPRCRR